MVAPSGLLWVSDYTNNAVRTINVTTAAVRTAAGNPLWAPGVFIDAFGTSAAFNGPTGLAVDAAGNVYVADLSDHAIRVIAAGASPAAVTTLAGAGNSFDYRWGYTDGFGAQALLNLMPNGIAPDVAGRITVSDTATNILRLVVVGSGLMTTLAGGGSGCYGSGICGTAGYLDGVASSALFNAPRGLAADAKGNVFVADSGNDAIRRVSLPSGNVFTVAGGGSVVLTPCIGTNARFNAPLDLTLAPGNVIYVADTGFNLIRKVVVGSGADDDDAVESLGAVSVLAGGAGGTVAGYVNAVGTNAQFNNPRGITSDASGSFLFVAEWNNHMIRRIDISTGSVALLAGGNGATTAGYVNSIGSNAQFRNPWQLAADLSGNVFVADYSNYVIRRVVAATGAVTTFAGTGGGGSADGPALSAQVGAYPNAIAVDPAGSTVYFTDYYRLRAISQPSMTASPSLQSTRSRTATASPAAVSPTPTQAPMLGSVAVLAGGGRAAYSGSADGRGSAALFSAPLGVAFSLGSLFVCDTANNVVRQVNASSGVTITLAGGGSLFGVAAGYVNAVGYSALFSAPAGIARTPSNELLLVADSGNNLVRVIAIDSASVDTLAGGGSTGGVLAGYADGTGSAAQFSNPQAVAVNPAGTLVFVADYANSLVRQINLASADVTVLAGGGSSGGTAAGYADGAGSAARFSGPRGVAADAASVYVADALNNLLRRIVVATRAVTTLAGGGIVGSTYGAGFLDGVGAAAILSTPSALALDGAGNLVFADRGNNALRYCTVPAGAVSAYAGYGNAGNGYALSPLRLRDGVGTVAAFSGLTRRRCG